MQQRQIAQLQHFYQSFSLERLPRLADDFLPSKLLFEKYAAGNPSASDRPHITNVNITDLDQDGKADVIVCDELIGTVSWLPYRDSTSPVATRAEEIELAMVSAPVHSEVFDFDGDGDLDMDVVASSLYFDWIKHDLPSLIWLENDGKQNFKRRRIAYSPSNLATIDVGDLDGDQRPDIIGGMHEPGPLGRVGRITSWMNKNQP